MMNITLFTFSRRVHSPEPPSKPLANRLISTPAVIAIAALPAFADDPPSLDELLNLDPAPPAKQPVEAPPEGVLTPLEIDDAVRQALEGKAAPDPLEQAVQQMHQVAARLDGQNDPGLQTQRLQQEVLDKLEAVIEQAKQQQQQQQQGGGSGQSQGQPKPQETGSQQQAPQPSPGDQPQPGDPQASDGQQQTGENEGNPSAGTAREAEAGGELEEGRREWGSLPARTRRELSEGSSEPYSPIYQDMTEAYYRRLAETAADGNNE